MNRRNIQHAIQHARRIISELEPCLDDDVESTPPKQKAQSHEEEMIDLLHRIRYGDVVAESVSDAWLIGHARKIIHDLPKGV